MELGMIGLGKMGAPMARRLLQHGHAVSVYDRDPAKGAVLTRFGARAADTVADLVAGLHAPRHLWVMLPAGDSTDATLRDLTDRLEPGDLAVDGGNSHYQDSIRRARAWAHRGLHCLDVGVSGGIWGLKDGYCLMIGGEREPVERLRPVWTALAPAPDRGWARVGGPGAGHFAKMVHNGIEYGLMQAYAEGFAILQAKPEVIDDLAAVAQLWQNGSVIRSWLLELTAAALAENPTLTGIPGAVADSGEGRWMVAEAIALNIPAPVITLSLLNRLASRLEPRYADQLLAVLRQQFGGHPLG
jgi:6-phosphogluconate dehydrogenase